MSHEVWIICDGCGDRAEGICGYDGFEHKDLSGDWREWLYRGGEDFCPTCASLLPPLPPIEHPLPLTQTSVAYMAATEEYIRTKMPDAVGFLGEDGRTVHFKFTKEEQ